MQQLRGCSWNLTAEMPCISQVLTWCHSQQPEDSVLCFFRTGESQPTNPRQSVLIGCSKLSFCINDKCILFVVVFAVRMMALRGFFFGGCFFFSFFLSGVFFGEGGVADLFTKQLCFIGSRKVVQYLVNCFSDNQAIPAFCEQMEDTFFPDNSFFKSRSKLQNMDFCSQQGVHALPSCYLTKRAK